MGQDNDNCELTCLTFVPSLCFIAASGGNALKRLPLILLFLICLVATTPCQEPSLFLAEMDMRLGMAQTTVVNQLLKKYELRTFNRPDAYLILTRGDQFEVIGTVAFSNGKLSYASKDWYSTKVGDGYKLADTLFAILSKFQESGEIVSKITTNIVREPNTSIQSIIIRYGKREVSVLISEINESKSVTVSESIRLVPLTR